MSADTRSLLQIGEFAPGGRICAPHAPRAAPLPRDLASTSPGSRAGAPRLSWRSSSVDAPKRAASRSSTNGLAAKSRPALGVVRPAHPTARPVKGRTPGRGRSKELLRRRDHRRQPRGPRGPRRNGSSLSASPAEPGEQSRPALARRLLLLLRFPGRPSAEQVAGLTHETRGKSGAQLLLQALLGHGRTLRHHTSESCGCSPAAPRAVRAREIDSNSPLSALFLHARVGVGCKNSIRARDLQAGR